MNLPTDTEIEKRAMEIAQKDFDDNGSSEALAGMYAATLEALKIDRESYALWIEARSYVGSAAMTRPGYSHADRLLRRIDAHLTTLRTRLGITE